MATAYTLFIPSTIQVLNKYTNGPPKLNMFAKKVTTSDTSFDGGKMNGNTWKKNKGPRKSLDRLGLSQMTRTERRVTTITTTAKIQPEESVQSRHCSHLRPTLEFPSQEPHNIPWRRGAHCSFGCDGSNLHPGSSPCLVHLQYL